MFDTPALVPSGAKCHCFGNSAKTVQSIKFFLMLHNMGVHYFFSHLRVSNNTRKTHQPDFARLQVNEDLEKFPCLARSLVANYLLTNQQPLK